MPAVNFDNDKFMPAPLPEICAPRHKLIDLYNRAAENRLTVVCAPAGYGKTVSALLWTKNSGRKSIWIGLDEYDNAPFVFYKLFCTGILSIQPENKKMLEILDSSAFYFSPVEYTIDLLLEFAQDEQSYALILDDLHTITNKEILKSLPFILRRLPRSFDILLLSRNQLPEEFSEFYEYKSGILISAEELAFTAGEIRDYYRELGHNISETQAQAVFESTGGWAIGINALSKSAHFEAPEGCEQILENYINKNIWEKWDAGVREFMLVTSVPNEMDAELCDILTGEKDAEKILDRLVIQNLFVVKTSRSTYRYHHLFLEFLRGKLKERPDIDVQGLNIKVADFYFERQEFFKALASYVHAGNNDGINRCLFQLNSGFQNFDAEKWLNYFMALVFDKLPEKYVRNNIALAIEFEWMNYLNGNAGVALQYIDFLNDYIASEDNLNKMKENGLLGFVCAIRLSDFRKGICEYAKDFPEWIKTLPGQSNAYINLYTPTITQNFPFAHRSICDCLEIAIDIDGRLQAVQEVFGAFIPKEANVVFTCVKAGLYYELNRLEKAYEFILIAQSELKDDLRFEMHFCVFMLHSQILIAMGKVKESKSVMEQFAGQMKEEGALYLNPNFAAVYTKHRLWDADREAAKAWLEQLFVTNDEQLRFYKLYQYFTTARGHTSCCLNRTKRWNIWKS